MQENSHASDEGPAAHHEEGLKGLLEDPSVVELSNQSRVVARLYNVSKRAGNTTFPEMPGRLLCRTDASDLELVAAEIYAAGRLWWTHAGAMCLLQGMTPPAILGPEWLVIHGTPTVQGSPLPGIWSPILAKVLQNPKGLPAEEVFKTIWQALGL